MEQESRISIQWLAGAADGLELLARAFSFPDEDLACALADGRFVDDAVSCASDLGIDDQVRAAVDKLTILIGSDPSILFEEMRQAFSRLYLVPGNERTLYPYEGPFRFMADGRPGKPSVFANRAATEMETLTKAEGLVPDPERHEPSDSIWFELAYLSLLYGKLYLAIEDGEGSGAPVAELRDKIAYFQRIHGRPWMLAFMEQTQSETQGVYHTLALWGAAVLECILCTNHE